MAQHDYTKFNLETLGGDTSAFAIKDRVQTAPQQIKQGDRLLLEQCADLWNSLQDFRDRRERARKYYRGEQWGDLVYDPDTCQYVKEEDYIKSQGKVPLKQNQIRPAMKNLIGQYRVDSTKPAVIARKRVDASVSEMLTNTLQYGLNVNDAKELDTRSFEEFLLSGALIQKTGYSFNKEKQSEEIKLSRVSTPSAFFTSNILNTEDDIKMIGQFHDMYIDDIVSAFAGDSSKKAAEIRQIYAYVTDPKTGMSVTGEALSAYFIDNLNFYLTVEPSKGRVFEIWEEKHEMRLRCHDYQKGEYFVTPKTNKKHIDNENRARMSMALEQFRIAKPELSEEEIIAYTKDRVPLIQYKERYETYWYVKYLSPYGHLLHEMESPYAHKSHPYTLLLYPLVDGEVWGFVEDIIDQQRYINRLVIMLDFIIGSSAKGLLLVPEEAIPDDMNINDFAESYSKAGGVIKIKTKGGVKIPQQIASNATNIGIHELLDLQLRFLNEISGVSGSSQGQDGKNKPASLYAQETNNSAVNSRDYFESFNNFKRKRNWKLLKTQIQYYEEEKQLALTGSNLNKESLTYDPEKAKDIQFEMAMGQAPDSPIYRGVIEENLKEFLGAQLITFETYLKNTTLPFADNLLLDIQNPEGQQVNPNAMGQVGNYLQSQGAVAGQGDPKAMELASRFVGDR